MQGDARVIEFLNEQLTAELTAINQYFLHAKMQENWGYTKLAKHTKHESIDEMRHAEVLTDRILMKVELEAVDRLRRGIEYMRSIGDVTSANIFEAILEDEEHHIDYLETQLGLIEKLGEALYLQNVTEHPDPS
jgi:bacterioferritin